MKLAVVGEKGKCLHLSTVIEDTLKVLATLVVSIELTGFTGGDLFEAGCPHELIALLEGIESHNAKVITTASVVTSGEILLGHFFLPGVLEGPFPSVGYSISHENHEVNGNFEVFEKNEVQKHIYF